MRWNFLAKNNLSSKYLGLDVGEVLKNSILVLKLERKWDGVKLESAKNASNVEIGVTEEIVEPQDATLKTNRSTELIFQR